MVDVIKAPNPPTRFDSARAEAAERATVNLAVQILIDGAGKVNRALSLLMPAAIPGTLGGKVNKAEASRALSDVIRDLQEVVGELGE